MSEHKQKDGKVNHPSEYFNWKRGNLPVGHGLSENPLGKWEEVYRCILFTKLYKLMLDTE